MYILNFEIIFGFGLMIACFITIFRFEAVTPKYCFSTKQSNPLFSRHTSICDCHIVSACMSIVNS